MQLAPRVAFIILLAAFAACQRSTGIDKPGEHQVGDESYASQPPQGGSMRGGGLEDAAGGAPASNSQSSPSTAQRAIEEADIYKVVGDALFILNAYRGLQIVDISNLAAPELIARVPLIGRPVDLYVRNGTAYVAVSDYFSYGWLEADGASAVAPSRGSRVWAIDVSNPAKPAVLGKLPIEGDVDQTRIVGNILYVESRRYSWWYYDSAAQQQDLTFVQSFDLSDPRAIRPVDRLDFPAQGWETHANVTSNRITLSQSGWAGGQPTTEFTFIDISDASGKLALGAHFSIGGRVADRWGMDFDDEKKLFRAVVQTSWGNAGARLGVWSSPSAKEVSQVGRLELTIPEALTAARFDGDRVYAVTARCTDPLWIIDTADPAHPVLRGSLEMPGKLDFLEPRGDRIVALGHDAAGCGGAGTMNVSLFDVADAAEPKLLSRVSFGGDYTYINAQADDMRKVFQVLDALSLVIVPFQAWDHASWTSRGGTQLVDYTRDSLTLRGFAAHSGAVSRAFPVEDRLVAMSDQSLQILDATDRDHPIEVAQIDLARPVSTLAIVKGKAVELAGDWYRGDTEIAVTDASDPEDPTPLARLKIPAPYARMFRDGDILWFLARDTRSGISKAWIQAVDVSDPEHPALRGKLDVDPNLAGYSYGYPSWGWGDEATLAGHALVLHRMVYSWSRCDGTTCQVVKPRDEIAVVDLSNPDQPRLASSAVLENSAWSWGLKASGNYAWITHYEYDESTLGQSPSGRYFLDRIDLTDPANPRMLRKVNVPGVFFDATPDGQTVYTLESSWRSDGSENATSIHELALTSRGTAALLASAKLPGYSGGARVAGGYAYLQTWDWSANANKTVLSTVRLSGLAITDSQRVGGSWAWLAAVDGGKLFLQAGWYDSGVLIYDLSTPGAPVFDRFVRTEGYVQDIVVDQGKAYLPSGSYGVPVIDLTPGVRPAEDQL